MNNSSRNLGIDTVKAISIILVLIWHLQPVTEAMLSSNCFFGTYAWRTVDIFYRYVTLLAVPTFIFVSLYLFIEKTSLNRNYWRKRLLRLVQLFLFWTCIQFIFYLLAGGGLPLPFKTIIPNGGPDLPHVGGSVFYFLFILLKSIVLTFLFLKVPETIKMPLSVLLIAMSSLYFVLAPIFKISIDTMSMKNFYLYVPLAYYLVKYPQQFMRLRIVFIIGYFLAVIYEEFYLNNFVAAYGRLSVLLGVLSFISLFLQANITSRRPIEFLSKYSLGIFALHKYWQYIFVILIGIDKAPEKLYAMPIATAQLLLFIATVMFTTVSVYLLNKTKLKIYVS